MKQSMRSTLKVAALGTLLAVVVLVVLGSVIWHRMGRGMYEPGVVATRPLPEAPPLHVDRAGEGPLLVALHGGPAAPPAAPTWATLEPLQGRYTVLIPHQRGSGHSPRPVDTWSADLSVGERMERLHQELGLAVHLQDIERLRISEGAERLVLVGHSFGGLLAALYAAEYPERVEALVLVAPAPLVVMPSEDGGLYQQIADLLPPEQLPAYTDWLRTVFDFRAPWVMSDAELAQLHGGIMPFYEAAAAARGWSVPEAARWSQGQGGWAVLGAYMDLGRHHDWSELMEAVKAPTLVVHAEDDLQPEAQTRLWLEWIPHAEFATVPGGHFAVYDAESGLSEKIGDFLLPASAPLQGLP